MDIESLLRLIHKDAHVQHSFRTVLDDEGRVRFGVMHNDQRHEYVMVGDRFIEVLDKPPTQTFAAVGIAAFGPMGAREPLPDYQLS